MSSSAECGLESLLLCLKKLSESILMEWEALWHMLVIVEADVTLVAFPSLLGSSGSQSVAPRPPAAAAHGTVLEIQILGPTPDL